MVRMLDCEWKPTEGATGKIPCDAVALESHTAVWMEVEVKGKASYSRWTRSLRGCWMADSWIRVPLLLQWWGGGLLRWEWGERLMWLSPHSHFLWHLQDGQMKAGEGASHRVASWLTIQERVLGKEARARWRGMGLFVHVCEWTMRLVFDRGTIILLPVTPEECGVRFLLCESCPLTCHLHMDTISSVPFPPQPGNFPLGVVTLMEEVTESCLFKPHCSVNKEILYFMVTLTKLWLCFSTDFVILREIRWSNWL